MVISLESLDEQRLIQVFLSVDIAGVERHLVLLNRELKEAAALTDALRAWRETAAAEGNNDTAARLTSQINHISRHREWIKSRIDFLEDLQVRTLRLKNRISSDLNDIL